ncbi:DEAD-box ATP-dependent RNA helicase 31 [Rhynchospora pubera]|uniref:ATP-dependent RNA helicase n=1 Tax=Rhynchospora pubera TaxID=906938 RepID=A0AAV8FB67_9POAL|nr:DEAD-box ATP-dependent RNA helicase 31 [Rhynchospora pubera]
MAGRILSMRLLRSLQTSSTLHSPSSSPLKPSPLLLSHSLLANLRSSRFSSGRRASSNAGRNPKSLAEDEAELSDWIGDLKTDSLKLSLHSDSEDEFDRRSDRVSGKFKEREKFRGGDRNLKSSRASVKKRGFYSDEDEDEEGGFSERFASRGQRGGRGVISGRGGKDLDFDFSDEERGSRGRGVSSRRNESMAGRSERFSGGGRGRGGRGFGFSSSERDQWGKGGDGFSSGKKGRGGSMSVGQRGGRAGRGGRNSGFDLSEGENESDGVEGFRSGKRGRGASMSVRPRGGKSGRGGRNLDFDLSEEMDSDSDEGFSSGKKGRAASMSVRQRGGKAGRGGRNLGFDLSEDVTESDSDEGFSDFEEDFSQDKKDKMKEDLRDGDSNLRSEKSDEGERDENTVRDSGGEHDSYLSQKRFDECSLSQLTLKGVKSAGYERMTIVQEATLPVILKGKDVLAKARTGTGKTVAFLLPAIELVAGLPPVDRDERKPPINVLVVCPTRELADQAAQEAIKLVKYHTSIGVQLVIGGTRLALEQKQMQRRPCQILVATPGRLRDHMENTPGFATRLRGVKVLVLDEADRLLDMGFRTDIEKIVDALPKQRQTLLFSATVPDEVRQICYMAMKRDLEFINTVEEGSEETHSQVKQMHVIAPLEKQFQILYGLLNDHISENVDYKVMVFCTTAMVTRLVAEYLAELKLNVREIHSRKTQSYRTRVSKEFRESKGLILVSSDVSARGVDYPNVTLVIQLGVPADREQYIHRLGRTGRKGKEGTGILMLAPWEGFFLRSIQDLPITEAPLPLIDPDTRKKVARALEHVEVKDKESAYQAWLGYYNSNKNVGKDKYQLVSLASEFSHSIGLDNPPALPKLVLRKMGLNNIPGLRSR